MKVKTEAAAVIRFRITELNTVIDQAYVTREFGVAQRIELVVAELEKAYEFILKGAPKQETNESEVFIMPANLRDFMLTAPVGSRLIFATDPTAWYVKVNETNHLQQPGWARHYSGTVKNSDYLWAAIDFANGEEDGFIREVVRG